MHYDYTTCNLYAQTLHDSKIQILRLRLRYTVHEKDFSRRFHPNLEGTPMIGLLGTNLCPQRGRRLERKRMRSRGLMQSCTRRRRTVVPNGIQLIPESLDFQAVLLLKSVN